MPYPGSIPQYTPMAPFQAASFTPAPTSDQFLAQDTAALQPGLQGQQSTYQQALALQQRELALAKKAQADALSNFYYSTPPWSATVGRSPVSAPAQQQTPPAAPVAPAASQARTRTGGEALAALNAGVKRFNGKIITLDQMENILHDAGFTQNDQGRYTLPQMAY